MYIEMIFIDADDQARKTGVGAEFETAEETKKAFESIRPEAVDIKVADFLCDLHASDTGELVDTIPISKETFESVTGNKALSNDEYVQFDQDYWSAARVNRAA